MVGGCLCCTHLRDPRQRRRSTSTPIVDGLRFNPGVVGGFCHLPRGVSTKIGDAQTRWRGYSGAVTNGFVSGRARAAEGENRSWATAAVTLLGKVGRKRFLGIVRRFCGPLLDFVARKREGTRCKEVRTGLLINQRC